jgi:hypothetical protein
MSRADDLAAASRRKAQEVLGRAKEKESERLAARDQQRQAQDVKTARLRELRLAKEAADRAEQAAKPAKPARRKPAAG